MTDRITAALCAKLHARAAKGLEEYGVSLADAGLSRKQLLEHAQEEFLDGAAYLQALIEMEDRMAWQPIETAPKDGTEILLWCRPHSESEMDSVFAAAWVVDDDDDSGCWLMPQADDKEGGWADNLRWEPTHWMPLPEPPQ